MKRTLDVFDADYIPRPQTRKGEHTDSDEAEQEWTRLVHMAEDSHDSIHSQDGFEDRHGYRYRGGDGQDEDEEEDVPTEVEDTDITGHGVNPMFPGMVDMLWPVISSEDLDLDSGGGVGTGVGMGSEMDDVGDTTFLPVYVDVVAPLNDAEMSETSERTGIVRGEASVRGSADPDWTIRRIHPGTPNDSRPGIRFEHSPASGVGRDTPTATVRSILGRQLTQMLADDPLDDDTSDNGATPTRNRSHKDAPQTSRRMFPEQVLNISKGDNDTTTTQYQLQSMDVPLNDLSRSRASDPSIRTQRRTSKIKSRPRTPARPSSGTTGRTGTGPLMESETDESDSADGLDEVGNETIRQIGKRITERRGAGSTTSSDGSLRDDARLGIDAFVLAPLNRGIEGNDLPISLDLDGQKPEPRRTLSEMLKSSQPSLPLPDQKSPANIMYPDSPSRYSKPPSAVDRWTQPTTPTRRARRSLHHGAVDGALCEDDNDEDALPRSRTAPRIKHAMPDASEDSEDNMGSEGNEPFLDLTVGPHQANQFGEDYEVYKRITLETYQGQSADSFAMPCSY